MQKILIGYSMRSGSTLLQHILDQHPDIKSYGDVSSLATLAQLPFRTNFDTHICVKPVDLFYKNGIIPFSNTFTKFVWISRDPRDSYLSTVESKYHRMVSTKNRVEDLDIGIIQRWGKIYEAYFENQDKWYLIRYEDLVSNPDKELPRLFEYLGIPYQQLLPFNQFSMLHGGDYKISGTTMPSKASVKRWESQLTVAQNKIFCAIVGKQMEALGYVE